jgi:hypothetical protein
MVGRTPAVGVFSPPAIKIVHTWVVDQPAAPRTANRVNDPSAQHTPANDHSSGDYAWGRGSLDRGLRETGLVSYPHRQTEAGEAA